MTWSDFSTTTGQIAFVVALTGLTYRLLRLFFPDIPEAVMQFVAAIFSTLTILIATWTPTIPTYQWLTLGVAGGVFMSQNVIKSIDWISAAKTATGAPTMGIPEKPPAWYVDLHPELFPPPAKPKEKAP